METTTKLFEFTGETKKLDTGITLHRIRATVDTLHAKKGDIGGWIEKPENLCGNAWVSDEACVYDNARVSDDACVYGEARVFGNADIKSDNDHCGFDLFGSVNRHTHAYRTIEGVEITCGCFRGSIDEFAAKVKETHCGSEYEKQYKMIIELIKLKLAV